MKYSIVVFCILAYIITWGSKFLISIIEIHWISNRIPLGFLYLLAQFGPSIAGLVVIYAEKGKDGILSLLKNLANFKIRLKWYLFALFFELLLFIVVALYYSFTGGGYIRFNLGFWLGSFAGFFWNTISLSMITGLGEEIGWRGFLLPKLQSRYSVIISSLLLALIVSFWHLKTNDMSILLKGDFSSFLKLFLSGIGQRILISIPVTFIIVALFNVTRGSLNIMVLFHGASNASYEWLKEITNINDPSFLLTYFIFLLWIISIFSIPILIKQAKKRELVTHLY